MFLFSDNDLTNITVKDNIAYADSTGIFTTFSTINLVDSTFTTETIPFGANTLQNASSESFNLGCFISISAGWIFTIQNTDFSNGYATTGGYIYLSGNSDVTIQSSTFANAYVSNIGGSIYASGFSSLVISDCSFSNNTAQSLGTDLYLSSGTTTVSNSNFSLTYAPVGVFLTDGNFTGTNLKFTYSQPQTDKLVGLTGGAIYGLNLQSFTISDSSFTDISFAEYGGAIYISQLDSSKGTTIPSTPTYTINNCTFIGNSANTGGAIYIDNVDYTEINACTFTNNSAKDNDITLVDGDGGAIYYGSTGKKFISVLTYFRC